jgi:hypothetical protein
MLKDTVQDAVGSNPEQWIIYFIKIPFHQNTAARDPS